MVTLPFYIVLVRASGWLPCVALLVLVMTGIGLAQGHPPMLQLALYSITSFHLIAIPLLLWLTRILRDERKAIA